MLSDPYAIYAAARAYWENARYPAFVSYTVDVRVEEAGVWKTNHYHLTYDADRDVVHVNPVSDEEVAHPHHVPPGPMVSIFGTRVTKAESRTDYLGVPELAPNYSFGLAKYVPKDSIDSNELVKQIRDEFHDPARPKPLPSPSGLPEIADVHAAAHDYDITLAGVESIDGHADYHLKLRPVRAPKRYRLRDLWVDERTNFTDRLVSDGNFVDGPEPGVMWTVSFAQLGGAPYVQEEVAQAPLAFPGATYQQASVAFEEVAESKRPMDWTGNSLRARMY